MVQSRRRRIGIVSVTVVFGLIAIGVGFFELYFGRGLHDAHATHSAIEQGMSLTEVLEVVREPVVGTVQWSAKPAGPDLMFHGGGDQWGLQGVSAPTEVLDKTQFVGALKKLVLGKLAGGELVLIFVSRQSFWGCESRGRFSVRFGPDSKVASVSSVEGETVWSD